jgi:hypothetical protein
MGSLFRPKAPKPDPVVDPNDVANRKGEARLRRLNSGGSASTILTDAMEARASGQPIRQALVGMGG